MGLNPEESYLRLGHLIAEMPELGGAAPLTAADYRWLGRAFVLVSELGLAGEAHAIAFASDNLGSIARQMNANKIASTLYRALAFSEAKAPVASRGAYVGIGASFDALKAVAEVLRQAQHDVLIVDAYMDAKVFMDFAPLAPEMVRVRLLSDSYSTKAEVLRSPLERWVAQYSSTRPIEVRLSSPRALHDRLILVDGRLAYSLTQSLKDFAGRSPALVQRIDEDLAAMKVAFYESLWSGAAAPQQAQNIHIDLHEKKS